MTEKKAKAPAVLDGAAGPCNSQWREARTGALRTALTVSDVLRALADRLSASLGYRQYAMVFCLPRTRVLDCLLYLRITPIAHINETSGKA